MKKFPEVFKSSDPHHRKKMLGMTSYAMTHWTSVRCRVMRGDQKSKVNHVRSHLFHALILFF